MTTISVAMCTFNGGRYVEDQLRSIVQQSRPPNELVVCDDGSIDDTIDIVQSFARMAPFQVRLVVNDRRLGSSKNFEKAIWLARGSRIALADQDDVWNTEKLALQESLLRSEGLDAVFTDALVVGPDLQPLGYRLWDAVRFSRRERQRMRNGEAVRLLLRKDVVTGGTLMFSSRHRGAVLPIPEGWLHDAWIALVVAAIGRIGFADRPLIKYRQHGRNQIGVTAPLWRGGFLQAVDLARHSDRGIFLHQLGRYRAGVERLQRLMGLGIDEAQLGQVKAKIAHLRERADLPVARLHRFPTVLKELVSGRYHRYSAGWRSAGKDLLFRR